VEFVVRLFCLPSLEGRKRGGKESPLKKKEGGGNASSNTKCGVAVTDHLSAAGRGGGKS